MDRSLQPELAAGVANLVLVEGALDAATTGARATGSKIS